MRVAYVCADPGIPVWGNKGCSIHVQEVLRAFVRKNIECHLIALRRGGECPTGLEPVALHLIDGELPDDSALREFALQRLNERVDQLLGTLGPFDFVYERFSVWACAGVEFAHRNDIPGLLEVNAPLIEEQAAYRKLADRDGAIQIAMRAFGAATAVLAVSDDVAAYARGYGVADDYIHVLPNAVNPEHFHQFRLPGRTGENREFVIGFVGSLKPWHGVDQLIRAYAKLWDAGIGWRLVIVGEGPDRDRLETIARGLPQGVAESIVFLGMVPHTEVPSLLSTFDAAVAPGVSSDTYFSPLKLFEYMAAGLPVVAARCGQMPSLIQHGATGLLYSPEDIDALANELRQLRAEPREAERIGEAARRKILAHHTWQHRCDAIMSIVQQSIRSHQRVAI